MLKVQPQSFYQNPDVEKILVKGLSSILYKRVNSNTLQKEGFLSTHAMTLVLKGSLKIENMYGRMSVVAENQMIFLPKGLYMISDVLRNESEPFEAIIFFFGEGVVDEFIGTLKTKTFEDVCAMPLVLQYTPDIRLFTENLLRLYRKTGVSHHAVTEPKLLEFLHLINISPQGPIFANTILKLKNKEKRSITEVMEANFDKPLGVEDYAFLSGRSLSTFQRDFKRLFETSPKQWLIDKRLEKAKQLLEASNDSVTAIAARVGYENVSHFIKAFHEKFSISPKQFLIQKRNEVLA